LFGLFWTHNGQCMARSISIDDLTFAQVSLGSDSLVVEYCDSKSDQKGERMLPKNCYVNPYYYNSCISTALGCYLCIHDESWKSQKGILGTQSREVHHIDIAIRYLKYTDLIKKKLKSI
jgi:hypothetical protein